MKNRVIPILRIFDYAKAVSFYIEWLGFQKDWSHPENGQSPLYLQVSKGDIVLHLTEHHGDCSPGAKVFIEYENLRDFHTQLSQKNYPYNSPGLEEAPWQALTMEVTDPFSNKLLFNESQS